jgi:glycosyltransferase involved in cell wall biosynthesis
MAELQSVLLVAEPGTDGVFTHVEGLGHYLIEQGHEVHFAYSDKRGGPELTKFVEYLTDHGSSCLNLAVSNAPHPRDVAALYRLFRFAKRIRPDVIHSHSSKAGVLCRLLFLLGTPAKYIYSPHAYYGLARTGRLTGVYNAVERLFGGVGQTINASEDERHFAISKLRLDPQRCTTIPYPVDTDVFRPVPPDEKRELRRKLNIPEEALILGSMGRLSFQKDPATLYRAFEKVLKAGEDIYLLHVGRGELQGEMDSLAQSLKINHRLLRFEHFQRPAEFHSAVDAFILTPRFEGGWPMALLEAIASDLPIICGTGPGTADLEHTDLSHCWTAPPEDTEGFAKAIQAWIADRKLHRLSNHPMIARDRYNPRRRFEEVLHTYRPAPRPALPMPARQSHKPEMAPE